MNAQETISPVKINAQIAEIEQQRNAALTRSAKLAGDNAELIDLVKILTAEVDRLSALLSAQSREDRSGDADAIE